MLQMTATLRLIHILFKSIKRCSAIPALKRIWAHFGFHISRLYSLLLRSTSRDPSNGPLSPPDGPTQSSGSLIAKSYGRRNADEALDLELEPPYSYKSISKGETISLDDVMPSKYPLSGSGIHNTSRTSMNLEASRSAHSLNISMSRNASLTNIDGHSQRAASVVCSVNSGAEDDIVIIIQDPGSPPTPSSHDNASSPALGTSYLHPADTPTRPSSPNALRPSNGSTTSLAPNEYPISTPSGSRVASLRPSLSRTSSRNDIDASTTEIDAASPFTPLGMEHIIPIMPEKLESVRYHNRPTIPKTHKIFKTPPGIVKIQGFSPNGWIKCTHPEGVRYYHHPEKGVFSDSNLDDQVIYHQMMEDIETLQQYMSKNGLHQEHRTLVLYTNYQANKPKCLFTYYYIIDHVYSSVFFLDHYIYDTETLAVNKEVHGPTSWDHLSQEIEAQYWYHVQLYPNSRLFTKETIAQLRDIVLHFIGDTMTSPTSTAPYSMQDLQDILALTSDMDKNLDLQACIGAQSLLARQMFIFCRAKFLHFHGEPHARIERNFSVYGDDVHKRTWLVKTLSPILFFAPDFHLSNLQNMWVDKIMHKSVFREAMKKMNEEWDHFVLFGTVMLNANVAFLAIQSVDNDTSPRRSAAQISSYVSMFASISSIVLGLYLSRQNKTKDRDNIDNINEVQRYMESRSKSSFGGLETLAILYSLPYALLIWAMVSFFVAVALVCFINSDTPTRTIVGFCVASSFVLVSWSILVNWEGEEGNEEGVLLSLFAHAGIRRNARSSSSLHKSTSVASVVIETPSPTTSAHGSIMMEAISS